MRFEIQVFIAINSFKLIRFFKETRKTALSDRILDYSKVNNQLVLLVLNVCLVQFVPITMHVFVLLQDF
ncbi:hypothetical protein C7B80_32185 [Cyanosarcina cf. burmensis CCALA 770]|nr:hypothetical protein C7B80_32185 [Cyanosarcina cf. burmensis CCALA 770]